MSPRELSFEEVFQHMDDFDLCDVISCAVEERYGYDVLVDWPESVALTHRVVHFVWSVTGFLACEGVARFFNLRCSHSAYPTCFDILGLGALAEELRKALALFPASDLGDTDALVAHFGSWERIEELVDTTESKLYAESEGIQQALAKYTRDNKPEFESLLPEIRKQRSYDELVERLCHD
jgi:hypothetical protein